MEIRPQPGPQEQFLSTSADIAFYGGAAGGGKSWALLLEPLRHIDNKNFGAVIFRRVSGQVVAEGGLWDEAAKIYPHVGGIGIQSPHYRYRFPSGAKVSFHHLQHEKDKMSWQGSQVTLLNFDELPHFSRGQFFYMMSRNRSMCGIRPYIRATMNPTPDDDPIGGWVHEFVDWYIDDDGWAIPERSGVIRWFVVVDDKLIWADNPEELQPKYPKLRPKSFTFILSRLQDNKKLVEADPGYYATLQALPMVDRLRLLGEDGKGGNWKVRPAAGIIVDRYWLNIISAAPIRPGSVECRFFDFAGTSPAKAKRQNRDADYTSSQLMRKLGGRFTTLEVTNERLAPSQQDDWFKNVVLQDARRARINGVRYMARFEVEPGAAAQREAARLCGLVAGVDIKGVPSTTDKVTRLKPYSAQAEAGNVDVLDAKWTEDYLKQLHNFPEAAHDDMVDTTSGAFNSLCEGIDHVSEASFRTGASEAERLRSGILA